MPTPEQVLLPGDLLGFSNIKHIRAATCQDSTSEVSSRSRRDLEVIHNVALILQFVDDEQLPFIIEPESLGVGDSVLGSTHAFITAVKNGTIGVLSQKVFIPGSLDDGIYQYLLAHPGRSRMEKLHSSIGSTVAHYDSIFNTMNSHFKRFGIPHQIERYEGKYNNSYSLNFCKGWRSKLHISNRSSPGSLRFDSPLKVQIFDYLLERMGRNVSIGSIREIAESLIELGIFKVSKRRNLFAILDEMITTLNHSDSKCIIEETGKGVYRMRKRSDLGENVTPGVIGSYISIPYELQKGYSGEQEFDFEGLTMDGVTLSADEFALCFLITHWEGKLKLKKLEDYSKFIGGTLRLEVMRLRESINRKFTPKGRAISIMRNSLNFVDIQPETNEFDFGDESKGKIILPSFPGIMPRKRGAKKTTTQPEIDSLFDLDWEG